MITQRLRAWYNGERNGVEPAAVRPDPRVSAADDPGTGLWLQRLYACLVYPLIPLLLLRLLLSVRRHGGYLRRVHERFGQVDMQWLGRGCIWVHAVSVGEVQAALPLISRLRQRYPDRPVLFTTTTPTGSDAVDRLLGDDVAHAYLPWDLPGAVRRFIRRVEPAVAVIVETELWPNLFQACGDRHIPLILVSGRLSATSVRRYGRVRPLMKRTLTQCAHILARSPEDARRFLALGAPVDRVRVGGNIKFDYQAPDNRLMEGRTLRKDVGDRPVWVAACTHAGEERIMLRVHQRLRRTYPDLLLVLVPRHPERCRRVASACAAAGLNVVRRGQGRSIADAAVLLADTMGELPIYYAVANIAFIGGSLVPVGGHNPVEAAAQGVPTVIGPHTHKINDTLRLLLDAEAIIRISDEATLEDALAHLLCHPEAGRRQATRAQRLIMASRGATTAAVNQIGHYL